MRTDFLFPGRGPWRHSHRRGSVAVASHRPGLCRPPRLAAAALALLVAAVALGTAAPAAAQADPSLQAIVAKLNRLEADLNSLQRNVYRGTLPAGAVAGGGAPARGADGATDPGAQLYAYEESLRRLTAQVEELAHRQRQMDDRLARMSEDVEFRLQEIEGKLGLGALSGGDGAAPAAAPATAARPSAREPAGAGGAQQLGTLAVDPRSGQPRGATDEPAAAPAALTAPDQGALTGTPQERYNAALRLIRVGQLEQAEGALQAFLREYPNDELAGNAQYWLGETYYARNQYEEAAAAFLAGYRNQPDNSKAPDNLLKLGVSLVAMGQRAESCPVFDKLLSEFPNAPRLIRDRARDEKARAGC